MLKDILISSVLKTNNAKTKFSKKKRNRTTNLFDTYLAANGNVNKNGNNRKDTLQSANETQETKTCETHTPKITSIEKGVTRVTFTQAVGDDEKNDNASSYDYDEMSPRRHR